MEMEQGKPVAHFLSDLFGVGESPLTQVTKPESRVWRVCVTRADFKATNQPWELNHWVPLVPAGSMNLSMWFKILNSAEAAERVSLQEGYEMEDEKDDTLDMAYQSLMDCVGNLTEKVVNVKRLSTKVHGSCNHLPLLVAADGNCGAWSLLSLLQLDEGLPAESLLRQDPLGIGEQTEVADPLSWQRMVNIRKALSDMWRWVTLDPTSPGSQMWVELFKIMILEGGQYHSLPRAQKEQSESTQPHDGPPAQVKVKKEPFDEHTVALKMVAWEQSRARAIPQAKAVKIELPEPSTPIKRKTFEQKCLQHSPPIIKTGRQAARAGVVRNRLVQGPSVPLQHNLDVLMARNDKARVVQGKVPLMGQYLGTGLATILWSKFDIVCTFHPINPCSNHLGSWIFSPSSLHPSRWKNLARRLQRLQRLVHVYMRLLAGS